LARDQRQVEAAPLDAAAHAGGPEAGHHQLPGPHTRRLSYAPQQRLYFLPLPHGQASLRPTLPEGVAPAGRGEAGAGGGGGPAARGEPRAGGGRGPAASGGLGCDALAGALAGSVAAGGAGRAAAARRCSSIQTLKISSLACASMRSFISSKSPKPSRAYSTL